MRRMLDLTLVQGWFHADCNETKQETIKLEINLMDKDFDFLVFLKLTKIA
jgi:hypothetical protein